MSDLYTWYSSLTYSWFAAIDYIEAIFWTLTYILIIFTAFINKNEKRFPITTTTIFINLAWEVASVILHFKIYGFEHGLTFSRASFIRFSWLIFDILILILFCFKSKKNQKLRLLIPYSVFCVCLCAIFFLCFTHFEYGMVISAFIIDAHMEVLFWKNRKKLDPSNRLIIGIAKITGDFFAGFYYGRSHFVVSILAVIAFLFDVMYIVYAINERKKFPEIKASFHNELVLLGQSIKNRLLPEKNYQKKRKYKKKQKTKKTHRKK